jgi:uncharacterized protein YecE (DUF72 family)
MNTIRIGPAGWSYKDWEGIVYPKHGSRFDHLAYLANYFDTIEVNSSFYRTPPDTHSKSWVRRVAANERFRFTAKLAREFTHEESFPSKDEVVLFQKFLEPLRGADRLGAVLVQFPWSFKDSKDSRVRIERIVEAFPNIPLVVEVRHGSFASEEFRTFLSERDVGIANIDQPLFGDSIKPEALFTGAVGYVRFHGRNYGKWFAHQESWERYDYLYSEKELAPWTERIESLSQKTDVFVVLNNHFRGQAIKNAGDLKRSLGQPGTIPEGVAAAYDR